MSRSRDTTVILVYGLAAVGFTLVGCGDARARFVFGTPENLGPTVNSAYHETMFDLSSDELELYFGSDRPGGRGSDDIWVAKRATSADQWGPAQNLGSPVNGSYSDSAPSLSSDGLELYFGSNRGGSGNYDIYVATRATTQHAWGSPVNLGYVVNSYDYDHKPSISADGLSLYLSSTREKTGTAYPGLCYIYATTRPTTSDPWGPPIRLGRAVNPGIDYDSDWPRISDDGLSLYFSHMVEGGAELWVAKRASVSDSWSHSINTGMFGITPSFSADGSIMYFSSGGGYGGADLWQVSVSWEPACGEYDHPYPVGDLNHDCRVDYADLALLCGCWLQDNNP